MNIKPRDNIFYFVCATVNLNFTGWAWIIQRHKKSTLRT